MIHPKIEDQLLEAELDSFLREIEAHHQIPIWKLRKFLHYLWILETEENAQTKEIEDTLGVEAINYIFDLVPELVWKQYSSIAGQLYWDKENN